MRNQVAIELLVTYGWVLLIVMVLIGALMFQQAVASPQFGENYCEINPFFPCELDLFSVDGKVRFNLTLTNKLGEDVAITKIILREKKTGDEIKLLGSAKNPLQIIENGKSYVFRCPIKESFENLKPGENAQVEIEIEYYLYERGKIYSAERGELKGYAFTVVGEA